MGISFCVTNKTYSFFCLQKRLSSAVEWLTTRRPHTVMIFTIRLHKCAIQHEQYTKIYFMTNPTHNSYVFTELATNSFYMVGPSQCRIYESIILYSFYLTSVVKSIVVHLITASLAK